MARGSQRLSPAAMNEIWVRLERAMRRSRRPGDWDCRPARFGRICCGVALSDLGRDAALLDARALRSVRRSRGAGGRDVVASDR